MIRLGIVEDDQFVRASFEAYFSSLDGFSIVRTADSVESFLSSEIISDSPNVILLDINLPGMSGIEGIKSIKERYPTAEILMITVFTDADNVFRALQSGAVGYLVKNTPLPEVKEHILQVMEGGAAITPSIARKVIEFFSLQRNKFKEELTDRERDVIKGIVDGLSYKLIADRLNISIDTVRAYIKRTYRKLHINSKGELITKYHRGEI